MDVPKPTQEEKDYAKSWKGKEKQKRLRGLIKKAGMAVNSRGPINAGYAPIMKHIDEVGLMAPVFALHACNSQEQHQLCGSLDVLHTGLHQ
jgi:hypothetical protein